jgi:light-regulated signal transduction histidine kinase (bacteriophytochrome)
LELANHELEAFAYSVSHDLRAPLRAMNGFSQVLAEDYGSILDETAHDYIKMIQAASLRMSQLIEDLLQLSRVTRSEIRITQVDLAELARDRRRLTGNTA